MIQVLLSQSVLFDFMVSTEDLGVLQVEIRKCLVVEDIDAIFDFNFARSVVLLGTQTIIFPFLKGKELLLLRLDMEIPAWLEVAHWQLQVFDVKSFILTIWVTRLV